MPDATTKWLPNPSAERGGDPLALWRKAVANVYQRIAPPKYESQGQDAKPAKPAPLDAGKMDWTPESVYAWAKTDNPWGYGEVNIVDYSGRKITRV